MYINLHVDNIKGQMWHFCTFFTKFYLFYADPVYHNSAMRKYKLCSLYSY